MRTEKISRTMSCASASEQMNDSNSCASIEALRSTSTALKSWRRSVSGTTAAGILQSRRTIVANSR